MKVLHIGHVGLDENHPDYSHLAFHPGRWVLNHALAQKLNPSLEVEVLMHMPGAREDWQGEIDGVMVHCLKAPLRWRSSTLFYFDVKRLVKRVKEIRPDVVHAHGTEDAYALAALHSGLPFLLTAQGMHYQINELLKPKLFSRSRIIELTERYFMSRCEHVIAKSEYVKSSLEKHFPHLKTYLIPNTFDANNLNVNCSNKQRHHFVFVGMIDQRKGVHLIADALEKMKSLDQIHLSIVGNNTYAQSNYEKEQIERLKTLLGDRLYLHGRVSGRKAFEIVSRAEALIAPSLEEMFGNQLIEALLACTTGIVSDDTALAENVRLFGNGLIFKNGSAESLRNAIQKVFELGVDHNQAVRSREKIIDVLGPHHIGECHINIYKSII